MKRQWSKPARSRPKQWEDPDDANEVTFGGLDDIGQDDSASDSWELEHQALARDGGAEKAAFLLKQQRLGGSVYQGSLGQDSSCSLNHPAEAPDPRSKALPGAAHLSSSSHDRHHSLTHHLPLTHHDQPQKSQSFLSVTPPHHPLYTLAGGTNIPHITQHTYKGFSDFPYSQQHVQQSSKSFPSPERGYAVISRTSGAQDSTANVHYPARCHRTDRNLDFESPVYGGNSKSPSRGEAEQIRASVIPAGYVSSGPHCGRRMPRLRGHEETDSNSPAKLPSMTDKDLEFVLGMHLKQLEMEDSYTGDYYSYVMQEKARTGVDDTFSVMAAKASSMSQHDTVRRKKEGRGTEIGSAAGEEEGARGPREQHTAHNLETLSKALGTLQMRTPKAPRRLMSYGAEETGKVESENQVGIGEKRNKLLREDERVIVRAVVEKGYDILGSIHDVVRGKSDDSMDKLATALFSVFCVGRGSKSRPSLVVRLCTFPKGMTFVLRAMPLLGFRHRTKVITTLVAGMSRLVEHRQLKGDDCSAVDNFWSKILPLILEGSDSTKLPGILVAFMHGHANNPNDMIRALSSMRGAKLLSLTMQKMYAEMKEGNIDSDSINSVMSIFCDTVVPYLAEIFREAESVEAIWNVVAMLDAFGPTQQRTLLRGKLKQLLESRQIDPPS